MSCPAAPSRGFGFCHLSRGTHDIARVAVEKGEAEEMPTHWDELESMPAPELWNSSPPRVTPGRMKFCFLFYTASDELPAATRQRRAAGHGLDDGFAEQQFRFDSWTLQ
jgi:hypothetical protein